MDILQLFMLAGSALAVMLLIYFAFSGPNEQKIQMRRMTALRDRHSNSTGAVVEAQMRRIQATRATKMDGIATRLLPNPANLKKRLDMTGKDWTPGKYLMAGVIILLVIVVIMTMKGLPFLLCLLLGTFAGLWFPHLAVGYMINRRIGQFNKRFPDAIELLVRGLRSGLPISETLGVVASEVPGPVGEEFRSVSDKIKIGRTMDAAMQETADRLGTPEFQFFCISLTIQRETGGNLAETLSNLATVLRMRAQMKLKIRAMSSESKASAYIIGALPFIVFGLIYMINPNYMGGFFVDQRLMITGGGGLIWMSIGAFIMSKMISFEI
ncbi:pilus assembly protein TadB [Sphingomonas paeninsulae]|jgi:tight adherence protein B|uniref:Pilus assembly protein TadB n=1 Tax=Sphingomonas paeninsulae TaxID=2319844 RepID=A0A494TN42_SPHPE|nr:type II secretion system F family protein [Sphingomonas paeninsulae]AYJ87236.1 pilus assembly protein TadB [Sphingomonas paeninsulae]